MFSFFKRNQSAQPAPEWCSYFTGPEYKRFMVLVDKYFVKKKMTYTENEGELQIDDPSWKFQRMGLYNLTQMCSQRPSSKWNGIVIEHFDNLERTAAFETAFFEKAHDYTYARSYLGIRIYHRDYVDNIGEDATISKPVAEDLLALLVFDFPHGIMNVQPVHTIQWNATYDELYQEGLNNIRNNYTWERRQEDVNGFKIWLIAADHFFAANKVLEADTFAELSGPYGALVGIPHRHAVLIYPISTVETITDLQSFIYILRGMYQDGPGSVSSSLYWHRDGQLTVLPYTLEENALQFFPPEDFLQMMNELPNKGWGN